jgi:hypothetical protein
VEIVLAMSHVQSLALPSPTIPSLMLKMLQGHVLQHQSVTLFAIKKSSKKAKHFLN